MINSIQIEVTTRCNYKCWYCTGRTMEQSDLEWDTFVGIVAKLPKNSAIHLQGEGEPTLWEHWWEGLAYLKDMGHHVSTIINGSIVDSERLVKYVDTLGVSLDTIYPMQAEKIGRFNVSKVMDNLLSLQATFKDKLTVFITDSGQDLYATVKWLNSNNIRYARQPLQVKTDYVKIYPKSIRISNRPQSKEVKLQCTYLSEKSKTKYFTVKGQELPCCYIKKPEGFDIHVARNEMKSGIVPLHCEGCRFITG